jgi:hypothetical protein
VDWGRSPGGFQGGFGGNDFSMGMENQGDVKREMIEVVGPNLRVRGEISLLRFNRLSDMINHGRGFVSLANAILLRRNGEPTDLVVPELLVNQDQISFIAQSEDAMGPKGQGADRPMMERVPRQLVIFTPGHTLTGSVHLFSETEINSFVDSPDPRFIILTDVTARHLSDQRIVSKFSLALINRTQIMAASLLEKSGRASETGVSVD